MEMASASLSGPEASADAAVSPSSLAVLGQHHELDCSESFAATKGKSFYDELCQHEETRDHSNDDRNSTGQASRQVSGDESARREEMERALREIEQQNQESAAEILALEARQDALRKESARLLEVVKLAEQSGELEVASVAKAQLDMSIQKQKSFNDTSSTTPHFFLNQEQPHKRVNSAERIQQENHDTPSVAALDQPTREKDSHHDHEQKSQRHAQLLQQVYQGHGNQEEQKAQQAEQEGNIQDKKEASVLQQKQPDPPAKQIQQAASQEAPRQPSGPVRHHLTQEQNTKPHKAATRKIILEEPRYDLSRTLVVPAGLTTPLSSPTGRQAISHILSQDQPRPSAAASSSNWRQQVVNRLRLPGPNMPREQFLTSFLHRGTAMTEHLLNAVFDQLKVETRDSRGFVTEHVTVPALLQVLEKHNGRDIVKMLDAAELLEANIRNVERKIHEPARTIFQQFAARWMCRFLISTAKKAYAELETAAHRFAPQPAVESYSQTLENYQHVLTKSLAAEKNLTMEQAHVVVSKCLHNMRMELENDLIALRRLEIEAQAAAEEEKAAAASRSRLQQVTPEEAQALGIPYQAILQLQAESAKSRTHQPATVAVTYQYPDGTIVTNPAHLPDGAKAAEMAAQAHIQQTAELAQQASKRAEEAAIAHVTAAAQAAAALGMPPTSIAAGIPSTIPLEGVGTALLPPRPSPAGEVQQDSQVSPSGLREFQGNGSPHQEDAGNGVGGRATPMARGLPPLPPQPSMRMQLHQQQQVTTRITSTMPTEATPAGGHLSSISQSSQQYTGQQQTSDAPRTMSPLTAAGALAGAGAPPSQAQLTGNTPQLVMGLASHQQTLGSSSMGMQGMPSNIPTMMMLAHQQQQQQLLQKEGSASGLFGANRQGLQTTSMSRTDKDMFRRTKNSSPAQANNRSRSVIRSPFKQAGKLLAAFGLWKDSDEDDEEEEEVMTARRAASEDRCPTMDKELQRLQQTMQEMHLWQQQQQQQMVEVQNRMNGEQLPQMAATPPMTMQQHPQRIGTPAVSPTASTIQPSGGFPSPQLNGDHSFLMSGGAAGTQKMAAYMTPPASARTLPGAAGRSTVYQGPSATARATALQQAQQYQQSTGTTDVTSRTGGGVVSGSFMKSSSTAIQASSFMQSMQQHFAGQPQQAQQPQQFQPQTPQQVYAQQTQEGAASPTLAPLSQTAQGQQGGSFLSRSQATDRESSEERRIRVRSLNEVPAVQLGSQEISNLQQVQQQLEKLSQAQLEAYARQYGLYATPEAAAAAVGGIPLKGVGALASPGVMTQQSAQSYTVMTNNQQSQLSAEQSISQYYQQFQQSVSAQQQQQGLMHHN